jgi:hypothetical protein
MADFEDTELRCAEPVQKSARDMYTAHYQVAIPCQRAARPTFEGTWHRRLQLFLILLCSLGWCLLVPAT